MGLKSLEYISYEDLVLMGDIEVNGSLSLGRGIIHSIGKLRVREIFEDYDITYDIVNLEDSYVGSLTIRESDTVYFDSSVGHVYFYIEE